MSCEDQQMISTLEADGVKKLELKVEPIVKQEMDRSTMVMDMFDEFDEEAEEFIQDVSGRTLGISSEELDIKDVKQEINENTVVLDKFDLCDEMKVEFIHEDKMDKAKYVGELEDEIFPNTSDEEVISEPKKSMAPKVTPEKRKSESFSHHDSSIKEDESISDPKLASISNERKKSYTFNVCGKVFKTDSSFDVHVNIRKENKPHNCETCGRNFVQKANLIRHMRTHTGERPYKCSYCPATFADPSAAKVHHRTHTKERPCVCGICGRSFARKPNLTRHMRTHNGERPYKCSYCPVTFADHSAVKVHQRIHTEERPYVCEICNKSFTTNKLKKHKREAHNVIETPETLHRIIEPKLHECEFCGRNFAHKHHFTYHMRTHTGERPYKCSYCPATFAVANSLKGHQRIHTNERPYVCNICGKSFATNILKKHEREAHNTRMVQTPETPYKVIKPKRCECKICGHHFAKNRDLKHHMRTHTGERPYKCSYCPATFAVAKTLKVHHRTHTNERPFVCDICNKSFASNILKRHKREAHNIFDFGVKSQESIKPKSYNCKKCESTYKHKKNLMSHMRKIHHNGIQTSEISTESIENPELNDCGRNVYGKEFKEEPELRDHKLTHLKLEKNASMLVHKIELDDNDIKIEVQ